MFLMSDAPRDGTAILLRVNDCEHGWVIGFWSDEAVGDTTKEEAGWYESEISGTRISGQPLGWRELPPLSKK